MKTKARYNSLLRIGREDFQYVFLIPVYSFNFDYEGWCKTDVADELTINTFEFRVGIAVESSYCLHESTKISIVEEKNCTVQLESSIIDF